MYDLLNDYYQNFTYYNTDRGSDEISHFIRNDSDNRKKSGGETKKSTIMVLLILEFE